MVLGRVRETPLTAARGARLTAALQVAGLGVAVFLLVYVSLLLPRDPGQFTPIGASSGLMLAVLLLSRRSRWPVLAAAGFVGRVAAGFVFGGRPELAVGLGVFGLIEYLLAATFLIQLLGRSPDLGRVRTIAVYLLIVAAAAAGTAAPAAWLLGVVRGSQDFPREMLIWATRDFAGMATLTPCLLALTWERPAWRKLASLRAWPLVLLLVVEAVVLLQNVAPTSFIVLAALLLVTWRLRIVGAALGVLLTVAIAVPGTLAGVGPFALLPGTPTTRLLFLQLFLTVCFYVSVPVAVHLRRTQRLTDELAVALRRSSEAQARYELIADKVGEIVARSDSEGRLEYVSPACRILGYEPEELIGQMPDFLFHPEDMARALANAVRIQAGEITHSWERRYRIRSKDGSYRLFESSTVALTDASGDPLGLVASFRDISEQQAAEDALAASEGRYRLVAENMSDLVTCVGRDGRLTFVSGACRSILGYAPSELIGVEAETLVHPDDAEDAKERLRQCLKAGVRGQPVHIRYRARRKDGSYVWVEAHPRAIFDAAGEFVEFQDVVRDITASKALEAGLEEARAVADAAASLKAEFLADLSHELRGPLYSVQSLARLARKRPKLADPVPAYLERIEDASAALLVLVDDVLEFSKLDAGRVVFRTRPVAVSAFTRACIAQFETQAGAKNLQLEDRGGVPADLVVSFDRDRVRQVVLNLLGNSVKFTRAGGVTLEAAYDTARERLTMTVADTGPGIPAERMAQLFQRFSQVSADGPRPYIGAGLGLAISKRIVEGMDGEIGATSEFGHGSRFSFSIPAPLSRAADAWQEEPASAPRLRVLVVDTDPETGRVVAQSLGSVIAEVLVATDPEAALVQAAREPVDLILLDEALMEAEGQSLLRRIRRRRGPNMVTPALALAKAGGERHVESAMAAGFEGLVAKPLSRTELVSAMAHALVVVRDPQLAAAAARPRAPRGADRTRAPKRAGRGR